MITVEQIRAARAMLALKQEELAAKAGISTGTLNNIERNAQSDPKRSTLQAIQSALEAEGIVFTEHPTEGFGLRLKPNRTLKHPRTILIIDDNSSDRKLYKAWLNTGPVKQYEIIEADNASSGYEAFVNHMPKCIILDFLMYGKNGFQLLVQMKKENAVIPPIIFVSGTKDEGVKKDILALGVHSYLSKTNLTQDALCQSVSKAFAK